MVQFEQRSEEFHSLALNRDGQRLALRSGVGRIVAATGLELLGGSLNFHEKDLRDEKPRLSAASRVGVEPALEKGPMVEVELGLDFNWSAGFGPDPTTRPAPDSVSDSPLRCLTRPLQRTNEHM